MQSIDNIIYQHNLLYNLNYNLNYNLIINNKTG